MFSFMIFIFLGFLAIVMACLYLLYSQEKFFHLLKDEHAELRLLLRSMEARLAEFEQQQGWAKSAKQDELLHLSFPEPKPQEDGDAALLRKLGKEEFKRP